MHEASINFLETHEDGITGTYRHQNQPANEAGLWKSKLRLAVAAPAVETITHPDELWADATEQYLLRQRDGQPTGCMFEMMHRPLTNGDNTCWMNAVLQALLSVLMDLKDTPAKLEYGTTEAAHSIFLCAFDELATSPVPKALLIRKLVHYGFVKATDIGNQEDASLFLGNMVMSGPLSHIAQLSNDRTFTCGSCDSTSSIHSCIEAHFLDLHLSEAGSQDRWAQTKLQNRIANKMHVLTPGVQRACDCLCVDTANEDKLATRVEYFGRNQPACLALKFERNQHQQNSDATTLIKTKVGLPPGLLIQNGHENSTSRYRLTSVVFYDGAEVGNNLRGHFIAAVRNRDGSTMGSSVDRWNHKPENAPTCLECNDSSISPSPMKWVDMLKKDRMQRCVHLAFYTREAQRLDPPTAATLFDTLTCSAPPGQVPGPHQQFATTHELSRSRPNQADGAIPNTPDLNLITHDGANNLGAETNQRNGHSNGKRGRDRALDQSLRKQCGSSNNNNTPPVRLIDPGMLESLQEDNARASAQLALVDTDGPDLTSKLENFCDSIGFERFAECEALQSSDPGKRRVAICALEEQISEEKLSAAEIQERIVACQEAISSECSRTSPCAGCGILAPDVKVLDLSDNPVLQTLKVSKTKQDMMQSKLDLMATCAWSDGTSMFTPGSTPFTVHSHGQDLFHLDSAGCSGAKVQMCPRCLSACTSKLKSQTQGSFVITDGESKPHIWPKEMLVSGSDFGKPCNIGLDTNLSTMDRLAISPFRTFDYIVKLVPSSGASHAVQCQSAIKGHMISFPHAAPDLVADAVTSEVGVSIRPKVARHVHVTFVGSKHLWGKMKTSQAIMSTIQCKARKIVHWLVALSIFHQDEYFQQLQQKFFVTDIDASSRFDSGVIDLDATQHHLDREAQAIIADATISESPESTRIESSKGAPLHSHDDPGAARPTTGTQITKGCTCTYAPSTGMPEEVIILDVHHDDPPDVYFTMQQPDGSTHRQTTAAHLTLLRIAPDSDLHASVAATTTPALSHVLWNHEPSATRGDDPHHQLLSEALNMAATEHSNEPEDMPMDFEVRAPGGDVPVNEFQENDRLITCGFPDLFFLGEGVQYAGSIPTTVTSHWLKHHSGRFGRDAQLLFLLFNQLQRHSAAKMVAASVKSHPAHLAALQKLIEDPLFTEKATNALEDPESSEGRVLLRQIEKLITMSTKSVPFSAMERKAAISQLYSMVQFYGLPSWFVTVSPSENNNKIVMTIANQCKWEDAQGSENASKQRDLVEWSIVCDYPKRAQLVANDPVAAAQYFAAMTEAMMKHLCQLPCNHVTRKTSSRKHNKVGVLGKTFAHFAALECQGRGSLHFHAVIWSGLTPQLLQALASNDPEHEGLRQSAADVLDSMVRGTLDPERHLSREQDKADRNERLNGVGPADLESEFPEQWAAIVKDLDDNTHDAHNSTSHISEAQLHQFVERHVANITNYHTHSATCHKGSHGKVACRMANPQPICTELNGHTGPIELHAENDNDGPKQVLGKITAKLVTTSHVAPARETEEDFMKNAFRPIDPRPILWELGREGINGDGRDECVVPYSTAFSATSMSNTAIVPVGSTEQAKAVCFYLLKYITKDSAALENTRLLVHEAVKHVNKFPSTADDTGTTERTTKHLLNRIVNSIAGAQEISGQMAATALLKKPSCFASDGFWYAFIWPAVQHLKRKSPDPDPPAEGADHVADHDSLPADDAPDVETTSPVPEFEDVELRPDGTNDTLHDDEEGSVGVFSTKDQNGKKTTAFVAQHVHYEHRGTPLEP